eukprot:scaffold22583_cov106-Cylindrotheca_fusiformis.AAC.26
MPRATSICPTAPALICLVLTLGVLQRWIDMVAVHSVVWHQLAADNSGAELRRFSLAGGENV